MKEKYVTMLEGVCVSVFVLYNLVAAVALTAMPRTVEERFFTVDPRVPTPNGTLFLMHSIASFHVMLALLSLLALRLWDASARRHLWLLGCLLNVYDAASQFLYWGARTWTHSDQVYVDVGAPVVVAVVMAIAALSVRMAAGDKRKRR